MLGRIHEDITLNAANVIYKSFILPIFDYCDSAWVCCNKCDAVMLERLQGIAARVVFKVNSSDVALNSLRWSTLEHRRAPHVYLLVNKCLKKCIPQFLIDYFTFNRDRCLRRTRQSNLLHVPKVKLERKLRDHSITMVALFLIVLLVIRTVHIIASFILLVLFLY